jgi:hypothetical protein
MSVQEEGEKGREGEDHDFFLDFDGNAFNSKCVYGEPACDDFALP